MRRFLAVLAVAALSGCGGDSSTGTSASLVGTWNLTTVNGVALPAVVQAANPKVEVLSDQYIMTATGTFTQTTNFRFTSGTSVTTQTVPDAGTYTVSGSSVTVKWSDGSAGTGTVSGNTLTVADVGSTAVYTRQ